MGVMQVWLAFPATVFSRNHILPKCFRKNRQFLLIFIFVEFVNVETGYALLGGSKISTDQPSDREKQIQCSTVRIGVRKKNLDPKSQTSRPYLDAFQCTGTITGGSQITAAGHCFMKEMPSDGSLQRVIEWTTISSSGKIEKKVIPITSLRSRVALPYRQSHLMKHTQSTGNDFATLTLDSDFPADCITQTCEDNETRPSLTGEFIAAGYGVNEDDKFDKNTGYTQPDEGLRYGTIGIAHFNRNSLTAKKNQFQKSITCFGDSGGPLYYAASPSSKLCLAGVSSGTTAGEESGNEMPPPGKEAEACREPNAEMVFNRAFSNSHPSLTYETKLQGPSPARATTQVHGKVE